MTGGREFIHNLNRYAAFRLRNAAPDETAAVV